MAATERDAPGVLAIPPLVYGGFLALGVALDFLFPVPLLPDALQYAIGAVLVHASAVIALLAFREFRRAGTSFDVRKPATALVTTGPFRFSRNPGYLALALLYAGIAVAADSLWILVLLVPVLVLVHHGVIAREERYLERKFGEAYLRYKRSVRRWL